MKILFNYLKKYWKLCLLTLALASVNQIFSLLDPYIFRHVIDKYAMQPDLYTKAEFFSGVGLLLLAIVGVAFISRVAKNFQDYFLNGVSQRVGADLYRNGISHALALPYSVFEDERSGETLGKLQKVRQDTEKLIASVVNILFVSFIGFIFVAIYAISIYWVIAVAFFGTIPIIAGMSLLLSQRIKKIQTVIVAETTALAGSTTESLRNIELVKSLGLVGQEMDRLNTTTDKILKLELKKLRYLRSLSFIQGTVINLVRTSILFFMLYLIFAGTITFGEFFSLFVYSFFVFGPLQEVGNVIGTYREAQASLANFEKLVQTPTEKVADNPVSIDKINTLAFKDVSFVYGSGNEYALENIFYETKKGETIAFVGPSGSGKTSLVKLLVGLYIPTKGEVLYNGVSFEKISKEELRTQIGFVTQDTQLFAGTIRENLLFVKPSATDEECLDALNKAQCQNLLARGGKGLDTLIGEGGVKVSGGEKQRLSIARALLRTPALLIFDEATSALDSITEAEISKTIKDVSESSNHITILIAHRLSTIMHADTIYVLEKGRIAESGSHQQLLDNKGLYSAMWRQQIGERESR
ncbi:MAG: ATP-binding cassette, subfamily bacterial [Patescibacteria group bacterium]|nr:ATP-binding cassette, subfamily bacterial [Patescibacteria group bacterium]